jgi:hypothetical protein
MTTNGLSIIWGHNFHEIPSPAVIEGFTEYCTFGEDYERRFFWLIVKSQGRHFEGESERALWITQQLSKHHADNPVKAA